MLILGIETSCDETSVAVVHNGQEVLSNIIASSLNEHQKYGGIIPEIASRRQLEYIIPVLNEALEQACVNLDTIDAIAVTTHPGLIGSLLVGTAFSQALSLALNKPLIEINHIQAHLYANFLATPDQKNTFKKPQLPAIGLVASGGHTSLYHINHFDSFELLGNTLDDAAGEAYDKVARILNVGYPGGPVLDRLAQSIAKTPLRFKCAPLPGTLNFSFSGIKTAVLYHTRDAAKGHVPINNAEVALAFQTSVVKTLVDKSLAACRQKNVCTLLVGGGVAANSALRQELLNKATQENIRVFFPPLSLCIDNAAMIAGLAYHRDTYPKGESWCNSQLN